jgi:hypothetical protein
MAVSCRHRCLLRRVGRHSSDSFTSGLALALLPSDRMKYRLAWLDWLWKRHATIFSKHAARRLAPRADALPALRQREAFVARASWGSSTSTGAWG